MNAYVTLRGCRSARQVTRDASGGRHTPFVAIVVRGADHKTHRFELSLAPDGTVSLDRQTEGEWKQPLGAWKAGEV